MGPSASAGFDVTRKFPFCRRDEGKLIVIACHDREELEFLCDIIYEIKNGTVAGCEVIGE